MESASAENTPGESSVTASVDMHGSAIEVGTDVAESREGGADVAAAACQIQPLSKNQMKKQKKKERWLQIKAEKRQAEKQKKKKRFAEMRERGEDIGPSRKSLKKNRMVDSACRQRVVIDCSFDAYMTEKDTSFLVQQIQHSYAANRRADNPLQFYMCGIAGKAKQRLDNIGDYKGWDMHKEERDFREVFAREDIVYLSSESPNVLHTLDDSKVYVIGGLVDHNHHKGLCHRLAEERGLAHAQLPIGQFLQLQSRKVLTINHVFEILLRFTETKNWQTSLLSVLPQRKGVCLKAGQDKEIPDTSKHISLDADTSAAGESQEPPVSAMNGSEGLSACDDAATSDGVSGAGDSSRTDNAVNECESVCSTANSMVEMSVGVTSSDGHRVRETDT
ncbi:tRNA methyltransferase 10 homolog A-like [Babylonia areolata]|uniref:tRNA methyltransferase 10 homolog A-like n=1 Tax=Babylonia areolata TaxID=304850 RepID=UPI003FD2D789